MYTRSLQQLFTKFKSRRPKSHPRQHRSSDGRWGHGRARSQSVLKKYSSIYGNLREVFARLDSSVCPLRHYIPCCCCCALSQRPKASTPNACLPACIRGQSQEDISLATYMAALRVHIQIARWILLLSVRLQLATNPLCGACRSRLSAPKKVLVHSTSGQVRPGLGHRQYWPLHLPLRGSQPPRSLTLYFSLSDI